MGFGERPDSRPVQYGDLIAARWYDEGKWKIRKVDDYGGTDVVSMQEVENAHHVVLLKDTETRRILIMDASQEMFDPLVKAFPEITTGDFTPEASSALHIAIEHAFILWLEWNHPDMN